MVLLPGALGVSRLLLPLSVALADPGIPDTLSFAEPVRDPVFALLIALVDEDRFGALSGDRIVREIERTGRKSPLPVRELVEVRRERIDEADARIILRARGRVTFPAPYKVLAYRPGKIRGTSGTAFLEWSLGNPRVAGDGPGNTLVLEDARIWSLVEGALELDVDGWVDRMLGGRLDDTRVTGFALFRERGEWMGVALGYSKSGRRRSGVLRFRDDKVLFPTPEPYRPAVQFLRTQLERRAPRSTAGP